MLNDAQIVAFHERLTAERAMLDKEDKETAEARATVVLDQQSVGRLSRMDALQQQAMADATLRRRAARRQRIDAALARISEGEFGFCEDCGEDIAIGRLDFDPTSFTCVSCAKG